MNSGCRVRVARTQRRRRAASRPPRPRTRCCHPLARVALNLGGTPAPRLRPRRADLPALRRPTPPHRATHRPSRRAQDPRAPRTAHRTSTSRSTTTAAGGSHPRGVPILYCCNLSCLAGPGLRRRPEVPGPIPCLGHPWPKANNQRLLIVWRAPIVCRSTGSPPLKPKKTPPGFERRSWECSGSFREAHSRPDSVKVAEQSRTISEIHHPVEVHVD